MYKSYTVIYKSELIKHDYIYFIKYVSKLKRPKVLRSIKIKIIFIWTNWMQKMHSSQPFLYKSKRKCVYN